MSGPVLDPAWRAALGGGDLIETHAAWVVLSGPSAFKLKKPVARGYLDFTSVERRRAALQAELDLNAGHAPQIYRRLSWLTRQGDGAIALNGVGQRAEPVLEMVRFDQGLLLDDLARDGRFDGALARDLADAVFMSHEAAPVASASEGGAARIRGVLARAASACAAEPGVDATRIAALSRALDTRLEARRDLLDARAVAGFVRRCHGDLHLQNIVCLEGHPVLFDALEFDEALATTDTLYDLAFLLMDLTHRGLGAIAAAVLSQYLARLDDDLGLAGLALLPAFCGLRALIKAMTRLQRGEDGDMHEAGLYLALAERCAVVSPPRLIGVGGLSGTGKSTLAEALAPDLGAPPGAVVIRADLERKALEGVSWRVPSQGCRHCRC